MVRAPSLADACATLHLTGYWYGGLVRKLRLQLERSSLSALATALLLTWSMATAQRPLTAPSRTAPRGALKGGESGPSVLAVVQKIALSAAHLELGGREIDPWPYQHISASTHRPLDAEAALASCV